MKKITKICIGTLAFIFLFYHQDLGINTTIFSLIIWLLMCLKPATHKKSNLFWILSVFIFSSAFSFAWYGDAFSFFALLFSVLLFGIQYQYPRINILLFPILCFINYSTFIFRIFFFKYWLPKKNRDNNFGKKLLALVLIPSIFVLLFIFVYASGSDIFNSFLQKVNLNFNFFVILFLAFFGFFFLFNLWFMFIPRQIIRLNSLLKNDFEINKQQKLKPTFSFLDLEFERKSGEITLILLNVLLLFFIFIYNYEQFFSSTETGSLSNEVHQRVATIIFSIVMAIAVIMFYFKSSFNFDKSARLLKMLSMVWIILNAVLILSALTKNSEYVAHYGLTYKRIGVYIFLSLSLAGLLITYFKIRYKKTNIFLLSKMAWIFFVTFVICSWVNFSWMVTKYNIAFNKNNDIEYLKKLEFNKQILYNTYKNNPLWNEYFDTQNGIIKKEKNEKLLSSRLYYYYVNTNK